MVVGTPNSVRTLFGQSRVNLEVTSLTYTAKLVCKASAAKQCVLFFILSLPSLISSLLYFSRHLNFALWPLQLHKLLSLYIFFFFSFFLFSLALDTFLRV